MSKESQKRVIQINHALSGVYGQPIKSTAIKINDARKQILKKLDRKKKLSAIIYDQLYSYLEKFPQEKSGLNQQFVKKKKARMSEFQERYTYRSPNIPHKNKRLLTEGAKLQLQNLSFAFRHLIESMDSETSSLKD